VNTRHIAIQLPSMLALGAAALVLPSCGSSSSSKSTSSGAAAAPASAYGKATGAAAGSTSSTATSGTTAPTISLAKTSLGMVLVDGGGRTLYEFEKDKLGAGTSACNTACAHAWPPVLSAVAPQPGAGLKASLLTTFARSDGARQVSYGGHPLYTFVLDTTPVSTKGQGSHAFGADWYMVGPNGKKVEKAGS
jgi:predicted lipoprotein with Yx(FWY)xxD motif